MRSLVHGLFAVCLCVGVLYFLYTAPDGEPASAFVAARFPEQVLILDAGHGGEDGGAVSLSGAVESGINLAVAERLDAVFGLYGVSPVMLRQADISLHDEDADTIREKKVSDLHNRVEKIQSYDNAVLISIHQNTFSDTRYHGAQVFYANGNISFPLAQTIQDTLRIMLDPTNDRGPAEIPENVYLMNHIDCCAVLVECGFLSNPAEDRLLQMPEYQTKIAAALAGAYLKYQSEAAEGEASYGTEGKNGVLLYGMRQ